MGSWDKTRALMNADAALMTAAVGVTALGTVGIV